MTRNKQLLIDIEKHFGTRLRQLVNDTGSTCDAIELDRRKVIVMIIAELFYETVRLAAVMRMDERAFLEGCSIAYRSMIEPAKAHIRKSRS